MDILLLLKKLEVRESRGGTGFFWYLVTSQPVVRVTNAECKLGHLTQVLKTWETVGVLRALLFSSEQKRHVVRLRVHILFISVFTLTAHYLYINIYLLHIYFHTLQYLFICCNLVLYIYSYLLFCT